MKQILYIVFINLSAIITGLIFKCVFDTHVVYTDVLFAVLVPCVAGLMAHNKWL